jgi:hypothetical protein
MGRSLLDEPTGYFAPNTVKLLCKAFDEVWQEIGGNYGDGVVEERRTRLARVILDLGNDGERDIDYIKEGALEIMRLKERPVTLRAARLG